MTGLLERERELATILAALDGAAAGRGAVVVVQGPPGIGKSSLLRAAMDERNGHRRLRAHGSEVERPFSYGLVRQLVEPELTSAGDARRESLLSGAAGHAVAVVDPGAPELGMDPGVVPYGVFWLLANLAAEQPLAVVIDDVHWGDPASLACLAYLARRVEGLPIALVVAARTAEPGGESLDPILAVPGALVVEPAGLSDAAVLALVRDELDPAAGDALGAACHEATGGIPFYLLELLRELRSAPRAADPEHVQRLTPQAVVQSTMARLGRLGATARALAQAAAILGPGAPLRRAAALAGLDLGAAASAADTLEQAGFLVAGGAATLDFAHPILRGAVTSSVPPARRSLEHQQAARLLLEEGAPPDVVALHLQASLPAGDPETVATLRAAAGAALGRGDASAAISLLARALGEPPPPDARAAVLVELGMAEGMAQRPEALAHLQEGLATTRDEELRLRAAIALATGLFLAAQPAAAIALVEQVAGDTPPGGHPLRMALDQLRLQAQLQIGGDFSDRGRLLEADADPERAGGRATLLHLAFAHITRADDRDHVDALVERARALEPIDFDVVPLAGSSGALCMYLDRLDDGLRLFTHALESANVKGSTRDFAFISATRGVLQYRLGNLSAAEADIEQAFAATTDEPPAFWLFPALATLALIDLERGRVEAAAGRLAGVDIPPPLEAVGIVALLREAQAAVALAQGRHEEAAALAGRLGETFTRAVILNPAVAPWRSLRATALAGLDRVDEAVALAREEAELAERLRLPRTHGLALRTLGVLQRDTETLERAIAVLERSGARLELARALVDLGALKRRERMVVGSRAPLARGLDLATRCEAGALAERALGELRASGARPRKRVTTGHDALTASERRVCELATRGLSNARIAQALFVTPKTIEAHLGRAYRKLGISGREQLAAALTVVDER